MVSKVVLQAQTNSSYYVLLREIDCQRDSSCTIPELEILRRATNKNEYCLKYFTTISCPVYLSTVHDVLNEENAGIKCDGGNMGCVKAEFQSLYNATKIDS